MTRLQSTDIAEIYSHLSIYDEELAAKTGCTLRGLACHASGRKEIEVADAIDRTRAGIVPVRWGQGLLRGFVETTAGILNHLGFKAFVTGNSDVSGLAEAYREKADVIYLADDEQFVAINTETRQVIDNAAATAKGYVTGLMLMAAGLKGRKVLVLGCGPVGRSATLTLLNYGAAVTVFDINPRCSEDLVRILDSADAGGITIEREFGNALSGHSLVVDATNAAEIIHASDISSSTYIAAPGMPPGLSRNAVKKISGRLLHDPLQIGLATMAIEILK